MDSIPHDRPAPRSSGPVRESHTPGPWIVHRRSHAAGELWLDIGYRLPDGTERGPICDITDKQPVDDHARRFRSAAEIKYLVTPESEQWSNARLIASAPAMLAALESLTEFIDGNEMFFDSTDTVLSLERLMASAHAAIAAATGDQP